MPASFTADQGVRAAAAVQRVVAAEPGERAHRRAAHKGGVGGGSEPSSAKLRTLAKEAGFHLKHFRITSRAVTDADGMLVWVRLGSAMTLGQGEIGQPLADALVAEYQRRKEAGLLDGHQPFATLIATKAD